MNPLTLVKRIQNINKKEASLGISEDASWHAKYKDSAYVYVGGLPFDLTEGDLLAVFAQYGEIVDVNLVRDKGTGKSKGFAFLAYEDQRSTNLAVDNLNGAQILGRIIRVDHVTKYKKFEEEDEETKQQKREERGVCRAFQSGRCDRGDSCKFSHNEQRAANTGWGAPEDRPSRLKEDKFERSATERKNSSSTRTSGPSQRPAHKSIDDDTHYSRAEEKDNERDRSYTRDAPSQRDHERRSGKKQLDDRDDSSRTVKSLRLRYKEPKPREERNETTSEKYESKSYNREERYDREKDSRSGHHRDASHRHHRDASHRHHRKDED